MDISITLSGAEQRVLDMIKDGFTDKVIAKTLFISQDTVKSHRRQIIRKLSAKNTTNAVYLAIKAGLISWFYTQFNPIEIVRFNWRIRQHFEMSYLT